ncbi:MAG TPA: DUF1801 domain-containing protein [Polyangiales bacterium]
MAQTEFASVDDYIASQPESVRDTLQRLRAIIRRAVPTAEESISYKMPTYRLPTGPVIYFAGWKQHYSLYPITEAVIGSFRTQLAAYEVERGTVRFPFGERVPAKLIEGIAKRRAKEVAGASTTKPRTPQAAPARPRTKIAKAGGRRARVNG